MIDYFSLKYSLSQNNISRMHARWIYFIQRFVKRQAGKEIKAAGALSRKSSLLAVLSGEVVAFSHLLELYEDDCDFSTWWYKSVHHMEVVDFHLVDDSLFKGDLLCVPHKSLRPPSSQGFQKPSTHLIGESDEY